MTLDKIRMPYPDDGTCEDVIRWCDNIRDFSRRNELMHVDKMLAYNRSIIPMMAKTVPECLPELIEAITKLENHRKELIK